MTSVPEQVSAASKAQVQAQFEFFSSFATQAFESASRVVALNLAASRASVERSAQAAHTLIASRDPRDLLVLGGHAEEQMRSLFAYSRELMGIAGSVQPFTLRLPVPAPAPRPGATASAREPGEPAVMAQAQPEAAEDPPAAEPAPVAEPTPIAAAVAQGEPQAAVAARPAAAPVPAGHAKVEVSKVAPAPASSRRKNK